MNRSLLLVLGSLFLLTALLSADDKEKPRTEPDKNAADKNLADKPPPGPLTLDKLMAKNREMVPVLIVSLKDADAQVRQTAAYILANIGKEAVPGLIEALRSNEADMRANAAYVLAALGKQAQDAMPALVQALRDESPDVRQRAAYAIQRILSETPPPPLPPVPVPPMPPATEESKKTESKKEESKKDESKKNDSKKDDSKKDDSKNKPGAMITPGVIPAGWSAPVRNLPPDPGLVLPPPKHTSRIP